MSNLKQLLSIVNLMNRRRRVTIKDIMSECQVSRRTAYRHLTRISEANIPIQFDRTEGGYYVDERSAVDLCDLGINHLILTITGLGLLDRVIAPEYSADISALIRSLLIDNDVPVDSVVGILDTHLATIDGLDNCAEAVQACTIAVAIATGRRLRVYRDATCGSATSTVVENPSLRFDGAWRLADGKKDGVEGVPLSEVTRVSVL